MIRLLRSIKIRNGKGPAAMKWAKELTDLLNNKFSGDKVQVFIERFGANSTMYWIADYNDIAAFDQWQQRMDADTENQAFLTTAYEQALFVEGTIYDTFLATLP